MSNDEIQTERDHLHNLLREIRTNVDPSALTEEDVKEIHLTYKAVFDARRQRAMLSFSKGDAVKFPLKDGTIIFARVLKVNRKTISVEQINGWRSWNVSPNLLQPMTEEEIANAKERV